MRGSDRSVFNNSSLHQEKTTVDTTRPALLGDAAWPESVSTCTALASTKPIIWDTNRYYRDLGVPYDATRKQLMRAYMEKDGQSSTRLTYCFKQLLDPEIRESYDRTPLGDLFMDIYVAEMFERMAQADAAKARANGADITAEDVLKRWGLVVDESPDEVALDDEPPNKEVSDPARTVWPYRYYLWRTQHMDDGRLAIWQEQVRVALTKRGVTEQIAVGLAGHTPLHFLVGKVGNRIVVFLNRDEQPSEDAAEKVASRVVEALNA